MKTLVVIAFIIIVYVNLPVVGMLDTDSNNNTVVRYFSIWQFATGKFI